MGDEISIDIEDLERAASGSGPQAMWAHQQILDRTAARAVVLPDRYEEPKKVLTKRDKLGKKNVDPSVGGGVDRDKIPGEDFAGRKRSFPIATPGDVSDAASSIGRAGAGNYSSDKLKSRIISIAHRKGPDFVAELPESWK